MGGSGARTLGGFTETYDADRAGWASCWDAATLASSATLLAGGALRIGTSTDLKIAPFLLHSCAHLYEHSPGREVVLDLGLSARFL